jgi:serine/threonine protein kinase
MQSLQTEVIANKYRLGEHIYGSALSWVYEASFVNKKRKSSQIPLILKTIPRIRQDKDKVYALTERVLSEAQALASLNNPFIVKAIDYGEDATMPYLVMRRRSMNLSQYLEANGKLRLADAVPLLHNLATALDYAHTEGFIHRDIKPDNILLDLDAAGLPLYAYITDFGIAQYQKRGFRTETNQIIGTMAYMPPERLEGRETTTLSDVYSFGLVAYEVLAGQPLFGEVEAVQEHMNLILNPSTEFFQSIKAKLDPDVTSVVLKAISRKPQDRYPTATQFAVSLGQLLPATQLVKVNQLIARNFFEAGRADEAALLLEEEAENRFPILWISIAVLCLFGIGFLWGHFTLQNPENPFAAAVKIEASEEVSEEAVSLLPSSTFTPVLTPSPEPSLTASPTRRPSNTPTPNPTQTTSPTISSTPSITPTLRPEVDCEGASWIYHRANRGDSLSHYVYSLNSQSAFAGMDYEAREQFIRRVNDEIDFDRLVIGELVCLPAVPPLYVAAPSATVPNTAIPENPEIVSSGIGDSSPASTSDTSSASSVGGTGGSQVQATQPPPQPTGVPISVSVSSSCSNGNSGATSFRVSNNGSTAVSIAWRLMEGSNQIASGSRSLAAGESATAWSGNTKNKTYTLIVGETGASSGESCG